MTRAVLSSAFSLNNISKRQLIIYHIVSTPFPRRRAPQRGAACSGSGRKLFTFLVLSHSDSEEFFSVASAQTAKTLPVFHYCR